MIGLTLTITEMPKHGIRVKIADGIRNTQTEKEVEMEQLIREAIYTAEEKTLASREEFLKSVWYQVAENLSSNSPLKFGWLLDVGAECSYAARQGEDVIIVQAPIELVKQTQTLFWPQACKKIEQEAERLAGNRVAVLWNFFGSGGAI
jgi:hypothetical protein